MFEIPADVAKLLFFLIPINLYLLTFLILRFSDENANSRLRRWFHSFRNPAKFNSLSDQTLAELSDEERPGYIRKQMLLRLLVVYSVIAVFLLSNFIGSFLHVLGDVGQDVGNAGSEEIRTWVSIALATPFSAGWYGTFPWYGYGLWPPSTVAVFHEPWNWIFHTHALADNPDFFSGMATDILLVPIIAGVVILLPLLRRSVRDSFLPSYLHLNIGMFAIMSTIFNCFAEAFKLVILSNPIVIGGYVVTSTDLNGLAESVLLGIIPVIVILFVIFFVFTVRIGQKFYSTSKKAKWLYVTNIALSFWLSFVLAILV